MIVPPSPGVLCAYGDATTSLRDEGARTFIRRFSETSDAEVRRRAGRSRRRGARRGSTPRASPRADQNVGYQVDVRYHGQGFEVPVDVTLGAVRRPRGWPPSAQAFDAEHDRLFTFALDAEHELVNLRAVVTGRRAESSAPPAPGGRHRPVGRPNRRHQGLRRRRLDPGPALRPDRAGRRQRGPRTGRDHRDGLDHAGAARLRRHRGRCRLDPHPSRWPQERNHGHPRRDRDHPLGRVDVDPVTVDIIENALRNARYEMDAVLFRTAMSPGIREQHDEFPLIADPSGKMVVGQFGLSIPDFLAGFDGTVEEGDILMTSDPYACGAAISHANDWLVVMPVFHQGRIVGWAAMFGHMTDVGGKVPGLAADRRHLGLRGGRAGPAVQALQAGRAQHRDARADPQPGPDEGLEPQRPQRDRRRLPDRDPAGGRAVRPVRAGDVPVHFGRAAAAQLRRDEAADRDHHPGRGDADLHRLRLRRRHGLRPVQDPLLDVPGG